MDADVLAGSTTLPEPEPAVTAAATPALSKAAERRILAALCISTFLAALNFFAPTLFYPQMARDLQVSVSLLGQVVTLMAMISAGLGLVIGPLADRYGFRWPLVGGLLAIAITLLGTGLAPNYPVLLVMSIAGGLGDALVYALPLALAGTLFSGAAQRRAIGWAIAALSSAAVLGSPLLTVIGAAANWRVALAAAALASAAAAWFVAVALPPDGQRPTTPLRVEAILAAYAPLLRHAPALRLFGTSALRGVWWLGLLTYLGAYLGNVLGLGTAQIGLVYALTGGAHAASSVAVGRIGHLSSRVALGISFAAAALLLVPVFAADQAWLVLPLLILVGMAAAISGVGAPALLMVESPAGAGATMVLNGSILNFGAGGGAALGGILIGLGGYEALGVGLALVALAGAGLAWWPVPAPQAPVVGAPLQD